MNLLSDALELLLRSKRIRDYAVAEQVAAAPAKPKKAPKPIPADYIWKATEVKEVAKEDQVEEVAGATDGDFLGGFDAFDNDDYWAHFIIYKLWIENKY